jgi:EAL domain-containing protein (putative c-di-GMP-specific phosphodiesterase class I)
VLERACAPGRRVACRRCVARRHVNLSGSELADAGLPERVRQTLARTRLEPARLCLEVSERTVNADPERTIAALRETGVALALDELGPDVPPLAALTELPVEVVKIDRSSRTGSAAARATARSSPQC